MSYEIDPLIEFYGSVRRRIATSRSKKKDPFINHLIEKHRYYLALAKYYLALFFIAQGETTSRACRSAFLNTKKFNELMMSSEKLKEDYWKAVRKGGYEIIEI